MTCDVEELSEESKMMVAQYHRLTEVRLVYHWIWPQWYWVRFLLTYLMPGGNSHPVFPGL